MTRVENKKTVVILAGYKYQMDQMFVDIKQGGLQGRFRASLDFPDWDENDVTNFIFSTAKVY